jgi:thiol-disulfide isomerase/thioredoxin
MRLLLALPLSLLAAVLSSAEPVWLTDLDAAKAQGVKENKPVLVDFTGSDWCPPCKALHKAVFESPEFAEAAKGYVLVELDFPRSKPQVPELKAKNREWQQKYAVNSFPTVLLLDAKDGAVFGRVGGFGGQTAKEYLAKLANYKNTPEGRASLAKEVSEGSDRETKSRTLSARIDAAIKAKDRATAEAAMVELFADAPEHLKPMIPFNKARILLKIDPSAKEEALKLFDEAIKQAAGNEQLIADFKRFRERMAAPVAAPK